MQTKRNKAVIPGLLVVLLLGLLGCKPAGPKALLDGKRLLDKGRHEAAVARLEVATQLMSTNANAWNYLGIAYHQSGHSSNAALAYKRALALNPDLVETRLNLGTLWLETGLAAEAKSEFTAYNLRRPNAPEGFHKIAMAELQLRENAAAEQHIRKGLQLDGDSPEAWNTLGLIQLQQGKARDAVGSFGSALKVDPGFAPALINLAVVSHQQLGDRVGALKHYREYLKIEPRPSDSDSVAAVVRQLEQELNPPRTMPAPVVPKPASTAASAVAAQEAPPKPPVGQPARPLAPTKPASPPPAANLQVRVQPETTPASTRVQTARPTAEVSKPTHPSPPVDSSSSTAPVAPAAVSTPVPAPRLPVTSPAPVSSGGPTARAAEGSTPAVSPGPAGRSARRPGVTPLPPPRNTVVAESRTVAESAASQTNDSGTARSQNRTTAEQHAARGNKALQARRYVEAADAYRAAAKADPSWFQAQFNYAAAAIEAGRTTEAIAACEKALALNPDSVEARYNYALALKQSGRNADAAAQLEKVVTASPDNARGHLTLGNLYADQLGQTDKARLHYLKVLELNPGHSQAGAIHFWLTANPGR